MTRSRGLSPQAHAVLLALVASPQDWRYGYDLSKETGLKSGTLYPLLIRLSEQGLLEAEWREAAQLGRPPRHAYRLTAEGLSIAKVIALATDFRQREQLA
jgi:PadR family transcriptional regulator, regulatory protein PadR